MAILVAPTVAITALAWWPRQESAPLGFLIVDAFVVGVFCGQVFRRNITAWVVACLAFILLVLPQAWLAHRDLIPIGGLALFPSFVLVISWAWTGDWMNDLRGAARWLRLGAMV